MSTILKTLKKLEEEKSVLDPSLDLKRLVLDGDSPPESRGRGWRSKKVFVFASLMFLGLGLGLGYLLNFPGQGMEKPLPVTPATSPAAVPDSAPQATGPSPVGVSLAAIPEGPEGIDLSGLEEEGVYYEILARDPVEENPAASPASPDEETGPAVGVSAPVADSPPPADPRTPAADSQPQIPEKSAPEEPLALVLSDITIPGLVVKGVIYFSDGSDSNYILASTRKRDGLKLKAGDSVQGATLVEVRRDSAIFSYQGKLTRVPIGQ